MVDLNVYYLTVLKLKCSSGPSPQNFKGPFLEWVRTFPGTTQFTEKYIFLRDQEQETNNKLSCNIFVILCLFNILL